MGERDASLPLFLVDHVPRDFVPIGSPPIDPIPRQSQIHFFRSRRLHRSVCGHFDLSGYCAAGRSGKASLLVFDRSRWNTTTGLST